MKNFIRNYFTEFGLALGVVVSVTVAAFVTVWEVIENPGGIFRNAEGTNWQFVFDTAWSWLEPTFMATVVAASVVHLVWVVIVRISGASARD
ncbi:MAG: hypothetical protein KDI36_09970 [Pseudomonadales bacterium]|nr:hypothetical protein [Pseudomonadales bacterium]